LGGAAVDPDANHLATTWGTLKEVY
jgi:hypothetical protein